MKSRGAKTTKTGPASFRVAQRDLPTRLIDFLEKRLGISRNKCREHIDARRILVNQKCVWMARHPLSGGDRVTIVATPDAQSASKLRYLYEDELFLVVDKPAGHLSNEDNSIEAQVRMVLDIPSLRAAHRLDRWTSGCLLMAKDGDAFDSAVSLFRRHLVDKRYHALVAGRVSTENQTITTPIDGKRAVTHVRALDRNRTASHVSIKTDTGRTHQIRKHLSSINHPVLGDRHYLRSGTLDPRLLQVARQMLHAGSLAFKHPITKRQVRVTSPLPRDFRSCMKQFDLS